MPGTSSLGPENKENCTKLAGAYIAMDSLKQHTNLLGYKGYRPQNPIKTKLPGTELAKHVHERGSAHAGRKSAIYLILFCVFFFFCLSQGPITTVINHKPSLYHRTIYRICIKCTENKKKSFVWVFIFVFKQFLHLFTFRNALKHHSIRLLAKQKHTKHHTIKPWSLHVRTRSQQSHLTAIKNYFSVS